MGIPKGLWAQGLEGPKSQAVRGVILLYSPFVSGRVERPCSRLEAPQDSEEGGLSKGGLADTQGRRKMCCRG